MQRIFDEERRATGPIRPNLFETRRISPLDTPMKRLKWRALRRVSCLASNKMRHADATTMILNRPWFR